MKRNIVILNGSPRRKGNTAALVAAFTQGAEAAGHQVTTWRSWTSTAARAALGATAASPVPACRRTTWPRFTPR